MNRWVLKRLMVLVSLALLTAAVFNLATSASRARLNDASAENLRLESLKQRLVQQLEILHSTAATPGLLTPEMTWTGTDKATIERNLQAVATSLSDSHGISLSAFSAAPGPRAEITATVAFQLEGTTDWKSLLGVMDDILAHDPLLGISDLSIRPASSGAAENQQVIFRMMIWGFAPGLGKPS